ncbi:hypothetical protein SOVF_074970 [Spinacia oleracea]|nr:hypothetical protein SOVF_074970 [Spinacia oleracea]
MYPLSDIVTQALVGAGLESSNLNHCKISFNIRNLHHTCHGKNPYEQAISPC